MTHDVESLSEKFHEIYQQEVKRQGAVIRHPDNYGDLAENVKEYDRVLARYVLRLIKEAEIEERIDVLTDVYNIGPSDKWIADAIAELRAEQEKLDEK